MEAAIPISILAIGLARAYPRRSSLLENVIITGIGGLAGSVVAGAIFTLPALYILKLDPHPVQTIFICLAGGCLGVLFLIPLRRYFVRDMHGLLPYPEATAITEVLVPAKKAARKPSCCCRPPPSRAFTTSSSPRFASGRNTWISSSCPPCARSPSAPVWASASTPSASSWCCISKGTGASSSSTCRGTSRGTDAWRQATGQEACPTYRSIPVAYRSTAYDFWYSSLAPSFPPSAPVRFNCPCVSPPIEFSPKL